MSARTLGLFLLGALVGAGAVYLWGMPERVTEQKLQTADAFTLPVALPERLSIAAVNIDTTFTEPLGLEDTGEVEVPEEYERVGWYKYGPTPGELGPAVILGHVDSHEGPAVFYRLREVTKGDAIELTRTDGSVAVFIVTGTEQVAQDSFPTESVYGDIDHAGLRLITCTGVYDRGEARYSHNFIVYAALDEDATNAVNEPSNTGMASTFMNAQ